MMKIVACADFAGSAACGSARPAWNVAGAAGLAGAGVVGDVWAALVRTNSAHGPARAVLARAVLAPATLARAVLAPVVLSTAIIACAAVTAPVSWAGSSVPTAVFDFGFDDTSLQGQEQGPRADEQKRLQTLDEHLREMLAKSGCCEVIPIAPVAVQGQDIDTWNCNGCDVDLARKIGARISITGWVQKVSNLILNINLVARNVTTGRIIEAGSVDIRGNTDESWSRGLAYLLQNRLHPANW